VEEEGERGVRELVRGNIQSLMLLLNSRAASACVRMCERLRLTDIDPVHLPEAGYLTRCHV